MAITRLADVFPAHRRRVILFTLALQLGLLAVLTVLLIGAGLDPLVVAVFVLLPVAVLQIFAFIIIGKYALQPFDFLARTITQVSDQPHDSIPPNLNGTYHERTGLKLMVDTIYNLALNGAKTESTEPAASGLHNALLDKLPGGVIALDEERNIIYANQSAPVVVDSNGKTNIQLIFEGEDSLKSWLDKVEVSEVSAAVTWNRVQSALPGDPNRKVYDVFATYQKNGTQGIETLLLLVDQTTHYAVNEEDMDFIALAAHELRGPITVIRGYLDILRPEINATLSDDQRQLFDRLEVSASRLSGYVGNVLNASKYDRRHLKLHLREIGRAHV